MANPVKERIAVAEAEGAKLLHRERTRRHHKLTFAGPNGTFTLVCPGTPSDHRSILNWRADVRRIMRRQ